MPEAKKTKDVKDLGSWDEEFAKLKVSPTTKVDESVKLPKSTESLPSSKDLEAEWEQRIKDARRSDKPILSDTPKGLKKAESIEEIFEDLKKPTPLPMSKLKKPEAKLDKIASSGNRLEKIGDKVIGIAPEVKERELTGQGLAGLYMLYPMGSLPPLNILSKALYTLKSKSLDKNLEALKIPLYPEEYVSFSVGVGLIFSVLSFLLVYMLSSFSLLYSTLALFVSLFFIPLLLLTIPSIQVGTSSRDVDKQLPFALRHMSALLNAGISIFDSIVSVSKTDYGRLSDELDKVVWDVKSGENLADSLNDASGRIESQAFTRVTVHIRRALQMGGDVASIIDQIADDLSFEMRMKISDFVEKLNAFAIVYIIGGIVGPVVISVFSVVGLAQTSGATGIAGGIDKTTLAFLILLVFPLIMFMIAYMIKAMEPKV